MDVIDTERLPLKVWGARIDAATLEQARNLANLPFAVGHVALMPDAHVGFGMPIGGVLAADDEVIPHAVGMDIGCGVLAWRTGALAADVLPLRERLLADVQRSVPQGFDWHRGSQAPRTDLFDEVPDVPILGRERAKAERQLGTLGGGNHFVELQVDPEGNVWAMVHTGSRNVGKQVAEHYDRVAREENRRRGSAVPAEWGLAHLPVEGAAGSEYLEAMRWCLEFARENRRLIAEAVQSAIARRLPGCAPDRHLDVHHNYAAVEEHGGTAVVVHRKGAVRAVGAVAVPGSMGTRSYLGEGLASPESFESCSHGAGRAIGRRAAARSIGTESVLRTLEDSGVVLAKTDLRDIAEEAPDAYKDIETVMSEQRDLVVKRVELRPIGVLKG